MGLHPRPMVFYHLVWVEHIEAYLITPLGFCRLADIHALHLLNTLVLQPPIEFASQDSKSSLFILCLRTFALAVRRELGRDMQHAHRRLAFVHVLPAQNK